MTSFLHSAKFLFLDLLATIVFVALYAVTKNLFVAVILGVLIGVAQIAWLQWKRRPIDLMQWMSLFLVLASGAATLLTSDPRFILIKPSIIYVIVGVVMLKPGWMNRYLPPIAIQTAGDLGIIFGFVWSGLMFVSAGLNLYVATYYDLMTWTAFMGAWSTGSKIVLFLIQFTTMRLVGGRRVRRGLAPAQGVSAGSGSDSGESSPITATAAG